MLFRSLAEKIRSTISDPVLLAEGPVMPSVSIGVTLAPPGEDVAALIARADRAMYEAKRAGRDRVVVF